MDNKVDVLHKFLPCFDPMRYYNIVEEWQRESFWTIEGYPYRKIFRNDVLNFLDNMKRKFFDNVRPFLFSSPEVEKDYTLYSRHYALVSNKEDTLESIINDKNQGTIVGIYCINMPNCIDEQNGAIEFYDETDNKLCTIRPEKEDFLVFPSNIKYKPLYCNSERYRVLVITHL